MDMPSHDDRRRFADSTRDLPDYARLTIEDIELMDEEDTGRVINHGTTMQAIAAMERRIVLLNSQIEKVLFQLDGHDLTPTLLQALNADLADLKTKWEIARTRLAHYQVQAKQQN